MEAKGRLRQDELRGLTRADLAQWLGGRDPGTKGLKRLAIALDADSDYLIGNGDNHRTEDDPEHDNYALAAARMSFGYFLRKLKPTPEQEIRCRRVLDDERLLILEGAPRTALAWKCLAEMMDRGNPRLPRIGEVKSA